MAYQALGLGSSANDGTGDDLRTGGDKINDNFVEIYTKLGTGTALTSGISADATHVTLTSPKINQIEFEGSTADTNETTLAVADPTADRTITLPDATGTVMLNSKAEFGDAEFIADDSSNEQLIFLKTASAVNNFAIRNSATGGNASAATSTAPLLESSGGDANIDLGLLPKGTGHVAVRSTGGANNQGAIKLNCENNTHAQTLMGQPHASTDSGFFQLPLDGVNGQLKTITMVTDGGDATLTPATLNGGTTITFGDVGDGVVLIYNTTGGWAVLANNGVAVA